VVTCQDIKTEHTQKIVNAALTAGEGDRVHRMLSALVSAGIDAGYLTSPRLARVHWQAGDRPLPAPAVSVAGESSLWIDPAEIPSEDDLARLGQALRDGARGERDELMANVAAYSGLRWGELAALTIAQVSHAARVITVDRKVVEVGGRLYAEAPKNRKSGRSTRGARPAATRWLSGSLSALRKPVPSRRPGAIPSGWSFPSRRGGYWRSSNYNRRILQPAYLQAGWRDADGNGPWTWHRNAARVLYHRAVHVEARRDGRVADGWARELPDHA